MENNEVGLFREDGGTSMIAHVRLNVQQRPLGYYVLSV